MGPDADDGVAADGRAGPRAARDTAATTRPADAREAIFFVLGVVGIAAPALGTDGPPRTWFGWFLVVVGAAAGSVVATSLRHVLYAWLSKPQSWLRLRAWVVRGIASVTALALVVGLAVGAWRLVDYTRTLLRPCEAPLEVPVVTAADDLVTVRRLAAEFERTTPADRRGCPTAHLTVYDAPPAAVRGALLTGWDTPFGTGHREPRRTVGPRPLVWLPSSTLDVDRLVAEARDSGGVVPFGRPQVYARTPLALAAPATVRQPTVADQRVQLGELLADDVAVVRPDPSVSVAGELAVAAALGPPPGRSQRELDTGRRLEQRLGATLPRSGYPLADAATVLRAYADLSCRTPQKVAFLLPQQLVDRPAAAGVDLDGGDCPEDARELTVISTDRTLALEHPVVVLDWKDAEHDAAPAMARRFRAWLLSAAGQRAVGEAGLQVPPPAEASPEAPWPARMNPGLLNRVDAALEFQARVRRHARIVFALDTSLSMGTSLPAARSALDGLVGRLGEQDQIGLVTFGRERVRPVPPGAAGREGDESSLRDRIRAVALTAQPAGETPLWTGIGQALAAIRPVPRGPGAPAAAVVVVTDGRIALGEASRSRAVTLARRDDVRVFLVAVGVQGCDARLAAVADELGGRCAEPGDRSPGGGLDGMAAEIWGAAGGE